MTASQAWAGDDPNLWLENVDSPEALEWVKARNAETMASLGADPRFGVYKAEALSILTAKDRIPTPALRGGWVYNFWQDEVHVRGIWRRARLGSYRTENPDWEVLIDVDALGKAEGKSWVFKGANCLPPDFTRCLISLSDGGKDAVMIREFDIETGSFMADGFVLPEAKQTAAWIDQDRLLLASGLVPDEMTDAGYPRVIRVLHRGRAPADEGAIFTAEKSHVGAFPGVLDNGKERIPLLVRATSFFENDLAVMTADGRIVSLPVPVDVEVQGYFGGDLILSLRSDWRADGVNLPAGSFVSFPLAPVLAGEALRVRTLVTPTSKRVPQRAAVAADAVYVSYLDNVIGRIEAYRLADGKWMGEAVRIGDEGAFELSFASPYETRVFATYRSFLVPDRLLTWDGVATPAEEAKMLPARFDASPFEVVQRKARSKDGTMVPYFLVRKKGASDPQPTLLYGYGGFEIAMTPFYSGTIGKLWLEKGGQFALANIRGGGEFGPKWHQAALKQNRQRAFDDFIAVAEDLITTGAARAKGIGIMGGSNGGLLVGVAMTQRPDLFGAVVCQVPLLDMLRFHKLLAGASWIGEYGNPDVPEERAAIADYSPYQQLHEDADYPVAFITTSTRDDRVDPAHARKFTARLRQEGHKVYYFERIEGGHAAGADLVQTAERQALEYVYLTRQLLDAP